MSSFDYARFTGGTSDQFVVNAKTYSRKEAIDVFTEETNYDDLVIPSEEDVEESFCAYRFGVFDFEDGCYTLVCKGSRGSFPVWVIEIKFSAEYESRKSRA